PTGRAIKTRPGVVGVSARNLSTSNFRRRPGKARRPEAASQAPPRLIGKDELGEVYLSAEEIRARVAELGAEIARDYEGREPILVSSLKTSVFFLADLSRAVPIAHAIDFIALAGHVGRTRQSGVRLIKDIDVSITGRDVLLVEAVVDSGLTLNYGCRQLALS